MFDKKVILLFSLASLLIQSEGGRILAVMPTPSYSHQIVFNPLWIALSSKGHHVTLLTTDPIKYVNLTNFRQVDWSFAYQLWNEKHNISDIINNFDTNLLRCLNQYVEMMNDIFDQELEHPEVRKMISDPNEHFDLVIAEFLNPAMIAFSKRFSCPFIGVSPMDVTNFVHEALGNPISPALFPDFMSSFDTEMSFFERVQNTFYFLGSKLYFKYYFYPKTDEVIQKHFGKDTPRLEDLQRNASMIFLNINPVIHSIRPLMNNVLMIGGGTHFDPDASLPPDIQNFLDDAKTGAIYFSLGTNVKSKDMSAEMKSAFLQTFSELPYKILWKFEDISISTNSNMLIKQWLPQQQILKHPNVKLFITQGGLQSLEEAIYSEVPIVAIPKYVDQYSNVRKLVRKGMGVMLHNKNVDKETLKNAINEVLSDEKYKRNAVKLSVLLKEQPIPGLNLTVWWTEYVLKHKGAKFLKDVQIPLYQYLLLDVLTFLLFVAAGSSFLTYIFAKSFFNFLKRKRRSKVYKLE